MTAVGGTMGGDGREDLSFSFHELLVEKIREAENFEWHHAPLGSKEFTMYLRLLTFEKAWRLNA